MDTRKLQDLWHNAVVRGVIKAHCKQLIKELSYLEHVVYELCIRDARTTVALAKCAVRVFDARDTERERLRNRFRAMAATERTTSDDLRGSINGFFYSTNANIDEGAKLHSIFHYNTLGRMHLNHLRRPVRYKRTADDKWATLMAPGNAFERKLASSRETSRPVYADKDPLQPRPALDTKSILSKYLRKLLLGSKAVSHLDKLRRIHDHFKRVDKCNEFFTHMNEHNRSRTPKLRNSAVSAMQEVLDVVNSFAAHTSYERVSVMSPRLFSLFPETSQSSDRRMLSPTIFSFQKDGYLSLPELFDMITSDHNYQQLLLEVILDVSGAGMALEEVLDKIKPEIDETKNVQLPLVEELQKRNSKWMRARAAFDDEQRLDYDRNGYAFMKEEQMRLIYEHRDQLHYGINITELGSMSKEQKILRLEQDIRALATLDQPKWPQWETGKTFQRHRRAAMAGEGSIDGERSGGVEFVTLRPSVFTSLLGEGAALEVVTLSPHAFLTEIMFPTALSVETLSPRAFIAAVLSPNALIARILSPTAFRAEVLSPRALHSWVLSPEVFLAEILSPRFLDPRVLSPQALVFEVLSPGKIYC
ncbi:hypothetical protein GCK32_007158 [Trichostrongylus colubriformis]|uniref:Uncharacterized protein n=1 Tax=Trichostrongylus colubriformis TaxID=6319 RepID=A0AAN8IBW7_TRICO